MRTRDVVGKRIVRVLQARVSDGRGGWFVNFDGLELSDGSRLRVRTVETETGEYGLRATVHPGRPPALLAWEDPACGGCKAAAELRQLGAAGAGCADHEQPGVGA